MRKYVVVAIVLIGLIIWQMLDLYLTVQKDYSQNEQSYEQLIRDTYPDVEIIHSYRFHGDQLWWIYYVFLPNDDEYAYVTVDQHSGENLISFTSTHEFSIEEMPSYVLDHFSELTAVNRVVPAVNRKSLAWEVSAENRGKQLVYIYFDMETGNYLQRYTIQ